MSLYTDTVTCQQSTSQTQRSHVASVHSGVSHTAHVTFTRRGGQRRRVVGTTDLPGSPSRPAGRGPGHRDRDRDWDRGAGVGSRSGAVRSADCPALSAPRSGALDARGSDATRRRRDRDPADARAQARVGRLACAVCMAVRCPPSRARFGARRGDRWCFCSAPLHLQPCTCELECHVRQAAFFSGRFAASLFCRSRFSRRTA